LEKQVAQTTVNWRFTRRSRSIDRNWVYLIPNFFDIVRTLLVLFGFLYSPYRLPGHNIRQLPTKNRKGLTPDTGCFFMDESVARRVKKVGRIFVSMRPASAKDSKCFEEKGASSATRQ